jgi:uncharacterized protein (DUF2267 family)
MKVDEFFTQVQRAAALGDRREAERWSLAVLDALAEIAPDSETRRQLITQLPGRLKARLLEEKPRALLMDREALLQHIGAALDVHAPEAERALRAVYGTLRQAVSAGELQDFEARLPADVRAFLARTP